MPLETPPTGRASLNLVSLMCRDHHRQCEFYRQAFGWPEIDAVSSPIFRALDAGPVAIGFHADEAFDLLGLAEWRGGDATALHVTIDVGSAAAVDAAVAGLVALGATVVQGPFTTYYDARQVVLRDPEGNVFRISSSQDALRPHSSAGLE
jgi:predicted enzyme related to lactoylglutathione lyase